MLTRERLHELLHYDPETGVLTWLEARPRTVAGTRAGSLHHTGYRYVTIYGVAYPEHHVAWFYMTGEWPAPFADHENRVRDDNRWKNLRLATRKQNNENASLRCDSTSGARGVSWNKDSGKWRAYIYHDKAQIHLGLHVDKADAMAARTAAERELFTHSEACA